MSWELPDPPRDEDVLRPEAGPDWAFADALLALAELGHGDVVEHLIGRWPEIDSDVLRRVGIETGRC